MKLFAKIAAAALLLIGSSQISRAADTYTPNCRIVQMPTGSNDTLWGTKANAAFAMLDQCISQGSIISVTGGNVTLTTANNAADQARSAIIAFTGTPGVTRTITMPNVSKLTWVANSSNASLIFTAGAGTTATVISGATALIYTDSLTNAVAVMNVASSAQAILSVGLGSAASQPSSAFDAAGSAAAITASYGANVGAWISTPSSANLAAALTTKTGTGNVVFSANPTFTGSIAVGGTTIPASEVTAGGTQNTNYAMSAIASYAKYLVLLSWNGGSGFALVGVSVTGVVTTISSSNALGGDNSFDTTNSFSSNGGVGIAFFSSGGVMFVQTKATYTGGVITDHRFGG